jgi:2-dehydro-3-deoxyphosphogluconate aldolase / (4S)-4-hydroxy-2-oxoglutarate aldolase
MSARDATLLDMLREDRVLSVVRADRIPDAAELCHALVRGGIRIVELTFTTLDVLSHVRRAAATANSTGAVVGVGTVMTAADARAAIDAGAQFLVTPGLRPDVAEEAVTRGVPVFLGAFTPSEVAQAVDLGSTAVKIFPAGQLGPKYLKDLHGPYPDVPLLPSGGISEGNARSFLDAGALAVCAGTSVVPPASVASAAWQDVTDRARRFVAALTPTPGR